MRNGTRATKIVEDRYWEGERQMKKTKRQNTHGLRRFVDHTVVGIITGGCVLMVHLLDATLGIALALSGITTAFVILSRVLSEKTDEERMLMFIDELLEQGVVSEKGETNEEEEVE